MKRSPIKHKAKRYPVPKSVIALVETRAGGLCEGCGSSYGLQRAHIKHRGMGGVQRGNAHIINEHRNMALLCRYCHDVIDKRVSIPIENTRLILIAKLKLKTGWHEWAEEFGIKEV